MLGLGGYPVTS